MLAQSSQAAIKWDTNRYLQMNWLAELVAIT